MPRRHYLVSYDVSDDKRRTQIFKTLCDNGDHVQYSVFICQLNKRELLELKGELQPLVNRNEDQVLFLDLGKSEISLERSLECMGKAYVPPTRVQVV